MRLLATNTCFIVNGSLDRYEQIKRVVNCSSMIHCTKLASIMNHLRTKPVTNIIISLDGQHEVDKNEIWKIKKKFPKIPLIVVVSFVDFEFIRFCGQIGIEKIVSQNDISNIPTILRKHNSQFNPDDVIKEICDNQIVYSDLIAEALDVLKTNYLSMKTISELCHILGISNTLLSKEFKKHKLPSPKKVLDSLKVHHAVLLLYNKGLQISEVGHIVGIDDVKLFIVCFKRVLGVTPGGYRKKYCKKEYSNIV